MMLLTLKPRIRADTDFPAEITGQPFHVFHAKGITFDGYNYLNQVVYTPTSIARELLCCTFLQSAFCVGLKHPFMLLMAFQHHASSEDRVRFIMQLAFCLARDCLLDHSHSYAILGQHHHPD